MNNKDREKALKNFMWFYIEYPRCIIASTLLLQAKKKTASFPAVSL
jgi:hypothetical protein